MGTEARISDPESCSVSGRTAKTLESYTHLNTIFTREFPYHWNLVCEACG